MNLIRNTLLSLLVLPVYIGFASAALSPMINSNHPLEVDMVDALSEIRPELNCSDDHTTGITQCVRPTYLYTCSVAKRPSLLIQYHSNIATIEEFDTQARSKGLSNCYAGSF
ncbi:hypothetical protein DLD99_07875 [Pseudomonas kribbensis]|uniref:Uncharacterized protein n=1 Tax=Pseudomonas kribbensis TaxID=1628086 RepID=A0A345RM73_9PSED|nr:hypothetical protein [Pseudomonas kribbensis]AXI60389.1 hypothetical protein DLD99_07875 [Pseudomonas kribbensis]